MSFILNNTDGRQCFSFHKMSYSFSLISLFLEGYCHRYLYSELCFLRPLFRYPHFCQKCLECNLEIWWERFLKNNVKLIHAFRLTAPIHIIYCYIKKMCLSLRHRYFFIEQRCMRISFLTRHFFVFTSCESTRTVLNSIHMDNSVPMSALWLHQITKKIYFLLWNKTLR